MEKASAVQERSLVHWALKRPAETEPKNGNNRQVFVKLLLFQVYPKKYFDS